MLHRVRYLEQVNSERMSAGLHLHGTGCVGGNVSEGGVPSGGRMLSNFCGVAMTARQVLWRVEEGVWLTKVEQGEGFRLVGHTRMHMRIGWVCGHGMKVRLPMINFMFTIVLEG